MPIVLTNFRVVNLHGHHSWNVSLRNNRLILVGENGTGKSTFANLVYYFLTRQWNRLVGFQFDEIEAELNGKRIRVTPEIIGKSQEHRHRLNVLARRLPLSQRHFVEAMLETQGVEALDNSQLLTFLSTQMHLPTSVVRDLVHEYQEEYQRSPELRAVNETIASEVTEQILFLPTYRRIEQDLVSIFPAGLESEIRTIRERLTTARTGRRFVELVEFGMEDVEQTIAARMAQIKENVRTGLNNLTGTYLRDVIRGVGPVEATALRAITPPTLEAIFTRIGEDILPTPDKQLLSERIAKITQSKTLKDEDAAVAHFLLKIYQLYQQQQASERDVRDFVTVCNNYLTGKELVYDYTNYTISIRPILVSDQKPGQEPTRLEFRMLSSGEKQIVSLFSHIYTSGNKGFFVIIDEPELSLSVIWQRRFLPDILRTEQCAGLIAATHSPFIWENELQGSTRSLAEFLEEPR